MTKSIFRTCAILALALMGSHTVLAQDANSIVGTWDISVTVKNCSTGAVIRTVRSIQMFSQDGSLAETANTFLRGSSLGSWDRTGGETYNAKFWFFRYTPTGTFASFAQALNLITLSDDGSSFSASGTVQDFDASNNLISTGCVTQSATRLTATPPGN
jgi:hypothetical protein